MTSNQSPLLKKYLRPGIAVVLIFILFKFKIIDTNHFFSTLKNPTILLTGFFCFFFQILFFAWRWKNIVNLEITYSYKNSLQDTFIGQFFNFFIPSGVGGDIVKALSVSEKHKILKKNTFALVTTDRVIGLFCLILFSAVSLTFEFLKSPQDNLKKYLVISYFFLILAIIGLTFLKYSKKIIPKIKNQFQSKIFQSFLNFTEQIQHNINLACRFKFLSQIILISFLGQCFSVGFLYFVTSVLTGQQISILLFLPLTCFAFMSSAIPITPAGIGVGQFAFNLIFATIMNSEIATAVTAAVSLMQIFMLIISLPGGYFFSISSKNIKLQ